jgi:hypothetical protein
MLLEPKLGMCVQVLPPGGHVVVKQIDEMWDLHNERLHGMFKFKGVNSRRSMKIGNLEHRADRSSGQHGRNRLR